MKTKAAILVEQQQSLEIDEVEIPSLAYGQALVKLEVSRICGSQVGEIDGVKGPDRWLPHLLGHEGCGVVEDIGPEVSTVKPGDRVCLHWRPGAGIQAKPPRYGWQGNAVNAGNITTFNDYAIISENRMTPVSAALDKDVVALFADTITTGFGVICNDAQVKIGESVVIVGVGGIGLGAVLGARLAGAHPIVGIDLHAHKLDKAKAVGLTDALHGADEDLEDKVRAVVGPAGADVVIDGTGNPNVIERCYRLTQPQGRTILFGVMHHKQRVRVHTLPLHFGKVLSGSEGGQSQPALDIPRYSRMVRAGLVDPAHFVSHRGRLEDVNQLISQMRAGEVIHAMIDF